MVGISGKVAWLQVRPESLCDAKLMAIGQAMIDF